MRRSGFVLALVACGNDYDLSAQPVEVDPGDVLACPFTPISGTQLSKYDCNPVFSGTDETWGADFVSTGFRTQEVLGHPFYQIWYSAGPADGATGSYGLGYAVSANGTDWEAHPNNPLIVGDGGWDADNMDAVVVVWDDQRLEYVLAYQGYNIANGKWGMGIYTSPDGAAWSAYNDGNPVLDFTRPVDGITYCWPLTFTHDSRGYTGYLGGQPNGQNVCQMYKFEADQLQTSFTPSGEPVLRAGPDAYDAAGMASAAVVELDGTYYMFYVGFEAWRSYGTYQSSVNSRLSLATSTDGVRWEKSPDNPLPVNLTSPEGMVSNVAAQVVGDRIHLWVTDYYADLGASAVGYYLFEPSGPVHP
jgi:hypothetical protein